MRMRPAEPVAVRNQVRMMPRRSVGVPHRPLVPKGNVHPPPRLTQPIRKQQTAVSRSIRRAAVLYKQDAIHAGGLDGGAVDRHEDRGCTPSRCLAPCREA
jgi:hypothetical protein